MEPENSISVERIRDILECPVCLESPSCTPIYQCDNGHIVCKSCREKMSNCSLCQVELRDQRCRVAEEILSDTLKNKQDTQEGQSSPEISEEVKELKDAFEGPSSLLYGIGIAAGAAAGVALAPSLLSAAGLTVGSVAAKSVVTGMKSIVIDGAISGMVTLAGSASTVGLGVAGSAAAGTVGAAVGAASIKATKVFVKEFTSQLKKGIDTQTLNNGVRKKSRRNQRSTIRRAAEVDDNSTVDEIVISSSDDDSS